jgi:uncharacterized protein YkwD
VIRAAVVLAAVLLAALPAPASHGDVALSGQEQAFLVAINRTRAEHGLGSVVLDSGLVDAARAHSNDMVANAYFEHGPFWRRLESVGCTRGTIGEILGWDAHPSAAVAEIVWLWLRSPEHRAVLLDPVYREIGVGVADGRFRGYPNTVVVTADFWSG